MFFGLRKHTQAFKYSTFYLFALAIVMPYYFSDCFSAINFLKKSATPEAPVFPLSSIFDKITIGVSTFDVTIFMSL